MGYFPTYSLGNLYSAQFFETFTKEHPDAENEISQGHLATLRNWLKKQIHQYGRRYLPEELCKKVTGKPLSEKPFIDYLTKKYTALYHL